MSDKERAQLCETRRAVIQICRGWKVSLLPFRGYRRGFQVYWVGRDAWMEKRSRREAENKGEEAWTILSSISSRKRCFLLFKRADLRRMGSETNHTLPRSIHFQASFFLRTRF